MGWIAFLIIGVLAGWLAEKFMERDHGLLTNLVVGVIGAYIGGFLFGLLNIPSPTGFIGSLVVAVIGAVILLWVWGKLRGSK